MNRSPEDEVRAGGGRGRDVKDEDLEKMRKTCAAPLTISRVYGDALGCLKSRLQGGV